MPEGATRKAAARWIRADVVLLAASVAFLLWFTGPVLLLIFAAVLLAIALDGLAALVVRSTRAPRGVALAAVLAGLVLVLAAGAWLIVPPFTEQVGQVWEQLSDLMQRGQEMLRRQPWAQQLLGLGEQDGSSQTIATGGLAARLAVVTVTLMSAVAAVIVILAIAFFMAVNPALYRAGLIKLLPFGWRPRAGEVLSRIAYSLRWWLLGQLVSMLVLGTATSLGLRLFGVEAWLGLGVLVGLCTFIPFLGPILAGIPVLVISFAEGLETGLMVLAFYLVLQNVEGYFLTPMVQQQAVHMPPALLISMQVVLAVIFGFAGLMLAAPLAVVGLVTVNLVYVEDILGDRPAEL